MLTFIRRIFGWYDRRFSDDVRWVLARAHDFAATSGSGCVTTTHVLAAIALHPTGRAVFGRDAGKIFDEASQSQVYDPSPAARSDILPSQRDLRTLIQQAVIAKHARGWPRIEVEHL